MWFSMVDPALRGIWHRLRRLSLIRSESSNHSNAAVAASDSLSHTTSPICMKSFSPPVNPHTLLWSALLGVQCWHCSMPQSIHNPLVRWR